MAASLFKLSQYTELIAPDCFDRAMLVTERILRSSAYKDCVLNLFVGSNRRTFEYIKPEELESLLNESVITIDICSTPDLLGCMSATLPVDSSRIFINPVVLLDLKATEREYLDCVTSCDNINYDLDSDIAELMTSLKQLVTNKLLHCIVLLIHEISHLINFKLSVLLVERNAITGIPENPNYFFVHHKSAPLCWDYGHMIEKDLFGYLLYSSCSSVEAPFSVDLVIGCDHEHMIEGVIVTPGPKLMWLLLCDKNSIDTVAIDREMLKLVPGANFESKYKSFEKERCKFHRKTPGGFVPSSTFEMKDVSTQIELHSSNTSSDTYITPNVRIMAKRSCR